MKISSPVRAAVFFCALGFAVSACSAGSGTSPAPPGGSGVAHSIQSGGTGTSGGGGTGGGGTTTTTTTTNPLPQTAPATGVFLRESFGFGPDSARPQGDKGLLRAIFGGTGVSGFWVEYPGSKSSEWASASWNFAGTTDNPLETLPTTLQPVFNGVALSDWRDGILRSDDAVVPLNAPHAKYTVSTEISPPGLAGSYIGIGITTSTVLTSNLSASGQIWLRITADQPLTLVTGHYDVLVGSRVLASGPTTFFDRSAIAFIVDPTVGTVTVTLNGSPLGTWTTPVDGRYFALEGQGVADDVVARTTL